MRDDLLEHLKGRLRAQLGAELADALLEAGGWRIERRAGRVDSLFPRETVARVEAELALAKLPGHHSGGKIA